MSPSKYVQEAVKNVMNDLQEKEPGRPWPACEELLKRHSSFIPVGKISPEILCLLDTDRLVAFASIVGLEGL
jgi:hypothetical protein